MRAIGLLAFLLTPCAIGATSPLVIYDNALESAFADGSWASSGDYSLAATSPAYGGSGKSIRFVAHNWGGLQFVANNVEFNLVDYQSLTFYVNGGTAGARSCSCMFATTTLA